MSLSPIPLGKTSNLKPQTSKIKAFSFGCPDIVLYICNAIN